MYYEYPLDEVLWDVETQFMFGNCILVSPKVNQKVILSNETIQLGLKSVTNLKTTPVYEVNPILPETFYDWNTKEQLDEGQYQLFKADEENPLYIKPGTILPLLNVHENGHCQSLMQCYYNSHTIEVYLGQDRNCAEGLWYTDDGLTFQQEGSLFAISYQ